MALTWDQTKSLVRIQGLIEEMLRSLGDRKSNAPLRAASRELEVVVEQILAILDAAEPAEAAEFRALREGLGTGFASVQARGAAILGWLKGAVEAETLERRITEEARAYAEAKARREQRVGFAASEDAESGAPD